MKNQQFLGFGLLLTVALLGGCATGAPSAADERKAGQPVHRIGGQAGLAVHLGKREGIPDQSAGRIGGQAGLEVPLDKVEGVPDQSAGRIGGQAGLKRDRAKPEATADKAEQQAREYRRQVPRGQVY